MAVAFPSGQTWNDGEKVPAAQVVMTTLHAGGKFDSSTYKVSGGLHGVGVSCVNALSEELNLEIWRDGFTWEQSYSKGEPTSKLKKTGAVKAKRGTKVHFLPDRSIFTGSRIQLRHAFATPARIGIPEQRPADHSYRRAHDRRQDRRSQVRASSSTTAASRSSLSTSIAASRFCTTSRSTWKPSATA